MSALDDHVTLRNLQWQVSVITYNSTVHVADRASHIILLGRRQPVLCGKIGNDENGGVV